LNHFTPPNPQAQDWDFISPKNYAKLIRHNLYIKEPAKEKVVSAFISVIRTEILTENYAAEKSLFNGAEMTARVLIVDDEPDIQELLEITLKKMSLQSSCANNLASARELLAHNTFNLCLTDMRLPDGDGLSLVKMIQQEYPRLPVAVITAHGSTEAAIKAMKAGAFDFVSKPVDLQKLRDLVNAALRLTTEPAAVNKTQRTAATITGNSLAASRLREQTERLARSQAPVFISGESGSGKELAARAIHLQSARCDAPFVAVNCGAIPAELMESELFGHLKGSFTGADKDKNGLFQTAQGGTLFLDEVADLPLHMQVKLLRVIQEKAVRPVGSQQEVPTNVRILSASHKNLLEEIEHRNFRQDLYYRINVIELAVPSLRERRDDIEELSHSILRKIAIENRVETASLDAEALRCLRNYDFPGNVRELENILQRAAALCEHNLILTEHLELQTWTPAALSHTDRFSQTVKAENHNAFDINDNFCLERHLEIIERDIISMALEQTRWNKTAAAKKLGMSFRSFRYRLKKLKLE
jgi:two-component system response regulator PilR (NtrC family)